MVKDVTKFHKLYLGVGVCVSVRACMCKVSYRILSFGRGNSKIWC